MNFSRYCMLNASKYPEMEFLIERTSSRKTRRSITWEDFNDQTNAIANYLIGKCHLKKGDVVLQSMVNSIEWYVIYMGILKAGGVVAPANPGLIEEDIKYAVGATEHKVFVADETLGRQMELVAGLMNCAADYIYVGQRTPAGMKSFWDIIGYGDTSDVLCQTSEEDKAELILASGTTGTPERVCHTHGFLDHIALSDPFSIKQGYEGVCMVAHPLYQRDPLLYSLSLYAAGGKVLLPTELEPDSVIECIAAEGGSGGMDRRNRLGLLNKGNKD